MRFIGLEDVLEEKLENILSGVDTRREIFVWGYRGGGRVIYDLLERGGGIRTGIIDSTYESNKLEIKKPEYLQEISPDDAIILLCMKNSVDLESMLESLGFRKNINYFSMVEQVYGDSRHVLSDRYWFEYQYGVDIFTKKDNRDGECHEYVATPWESLRRIMASLNVQETDALFDYGMGKGGVIIQLALNGVFQNLGGVELDEELYKTACKNFKKLELKPVKAVCADARSVTNELDAYNYFFFYNPFSGSVFETVLHNIVDSHKRKERRIRIIYINTVCHDMIMASGIFRLEKQIEVNHTIPLANIYTTEIEER